MIRFNCPQCGHQLQASDKAAGRSGSCKHCNAKIVIPIHNCVSEVDVATVLSAPSNAPHSTFPESCDDSTYALGSPLKLPSADTGQSFPLSSTSPANDRASQSDTNLPQAENKSRHNSIAEIQEEEYQHRRRSQSEPRTRIHAVLFFLIQQKFIVALAIIGVVGIVVAVRLTLRTPSKLPGASGARIVELPKPRFGFTRDGMTLIGAQVVAEKDHAFDLNKNWLQTFPSDTTQLRVCLLFNWFSKDAGSFVSIHTATDNGRIEFARAVGVGESLKDERGQMLVLPVKSQGGTFAPGAYQTVVEINGVAAAQLNWSISD